MSGSIPSSAYVEHFDPELAHHRAWLQAVLERLVAHEPQALEEGGTLRRLWTEHQQSAGSGPKAHQSRVDQRPAEDARSRASSDVATRGNPLSVPWFSQLDSDTDQARRMCFSSSCAMLLAFLKPGVLRGANGDDQYLQRVRCYGDTTDAAAQLQALASYGIEAEFTQKASFRILEAQIAAGIPVPCGYLHRGPVEKPAGGGHWLFAMASSVLSPFCRPEEEEITLLEKEVLPAIQQCLQRVDAIDRVLLEEQDAQIAIEQLRQELAAKAEGAEADEALSPL